MNVELKCLPKPKFLLLPEIVGIETTTDYAQIYANDLIASPITERTRLRDEINLLPIGERGRLDETVADETVNRIHATNEFMPSVRSDFLHAIAGDLIVDDESDFELFSEDADIDINMLAQRFIIEQERRPYEPVLMNIFEFLNTYLQEFANNFARTQNVSARTYKTALSHMGAELAAWLYTYAQEEEDKNMLHLWLSHFALVSGVLVGARTNASLMAFYPDIFPPQITHDIHALVMAEQPDDLIDIGLNAFYGGKANRSIEPPQFAEGGTYMRIGSLMVCGLDPRVK